MTCLKISKVNHALPKGSSLLLTYLNKILLPATSTHLNVFHFRYDNYDNYSLLSHVISNCVCGQL